MTSYIPAQALYQSEVVVKHSRFIAHIAHTPDIDSAKSFLEVIRQQHIKANHNCWAQIAGSRENLNCWGSNDDGEPKGTAGKPMLNVIKHSELCEITVVVTRYFGGIKLGAGGLVRAYSLAVQEALKTLPMTEKVVEFEFNLHLPHFIVGDIETLLMKCNVSVTERNWQDDLQITGRASDQQLMQLRLGLQPFQHQTSYQDKDIRW